MQIRALLTATVLGLGVLVGTAPAAQAAPAEITMSDSAAIQAAVCQGQLGARYHRVSCVHAAPGTQYRAIARCSNGTSAYGAWHNQTTSFWTDYSAAWCPTGTSRTGQAIGFR
jgi:hypothetical protein